MKKILVTGANGLIGRQISKILSEAKIEWLGTSHKRNEGTFFSLDLLDRASIEKLFDTYKPDCVFHCANLAGGVNFCESNPDIAKGFHLEATKFIGEKCNEVGAKFVFVSTDYVFDGKKGSAYLEADSPNPLNLYGSLKLQAEQWITANVERHIIARTTNVYGFDPSTVTPNFIMSLWFAQRKAQMTQVPSYLYGNPTFATDLAQVLVELSLREINGIFHTVGSSFINRYDWAIFFGKKLNWNLELIVEDREIPIFAVPRPLHSNLNTEKYLRICKSRISDVQNGLEAFKQQIIDHETLS